MMAVELLGVGIASRHHRRTPGDTQIGLPQPHRVPARQAVQALDRRMQQLGVGRQGDVLGLHRGVDRNPRQVPGPQRPGLMRHAQALGQEQLQLASKPLAPMAQVRALVREVVLEELFAGEELEIRVIDPALAHAFVGQPVNVLRSKSPIAKRVSIPGRPLSL